MALTCQLERTARPVLDLTTPQLSQVRRAGAAADVAASLELLRQRVPGLLVEEGYYDDPRPAWWEGGTVRVNLHRADVSSALHELSEVWGAAYARQQPAAYQQTLQLLRGSEAHERTKLAYPELDEQNQLREALHLEVQQHAAPLLVRQNYQLSGAAGRLWGFAEKLFYRLGARFNPGQLRRLRQGRLTVSELAQGLARELVLGRGGVLSELGHQDLARLGSYARDQRVTNQDLAGRTGGRTGASEAGADEMTAEADDETAGSPLTHELLGVGHTGHLLAYVSGKAVNGGGRDIDQKARELVRNFGGKDYFQYGNLFDESGQRLPNGRVQWESPDFDKQLAQATRLLTRSGARPDGEALRLASDVFYRARHPLTQAELVEGRPLGMNAAEAELAYGAHGIFPDFIPGQKVVKYEKASMGADYDPAVDTGNLLVHLNDEGKPVAVAAITRQRLGQKQNSQNLLSGLQYYRQRTGSSERGQESYFAAKRRTGSAGVLERVSLTSSAEQLQKLQALALAMHLTQRGHQVSRVSVANVRSLEAGQQHQNAVSRVLPVAELAALKSIRQQPVVRQLLEASGVSGQKILAVLDDNSLYETGKYFDDYVGSLLTNYRGGDEFSRGRIQAAAGRYEQQQTDASLNELLSAVVARKNSLLAGYKGQDEKTTTRQLAALPEYVQLAHAEAQLRGVSEKLNPWKTLGDVERLYLDFANNTTPAMVYLVGRFKALKARVTQQFTPRARQRVQLIEALRAEKGTSRLVDKEQGLYRNLVEEQSAWRELPPAVPGGPTRYEQVTVPTWRFKLPGTAEFDALTKAEQNFITFEIEQIKDQFTRWHRASNRDVNTGEPGSSQAAEAWYEQNWSHGEIPLSPAAASTQRLQGNWTDSYQATLDGLLGQNPYFDDIGGTRLSLQQYYQSQGADAQPGAFGGYARQHKLGVRRTGDVHPDTGQALGYLVDEDWEKTQARFDQDLGRGQAVWAAEMLRHEFSQDAASDYKTAQVLLEDERQSAGLLRHYVSGEGSQAPGYYVWGAGNQAKNLDMAFRYLFHGDTNQGGATGKTARAYRVVGVAASVARTAIYAGNVFIPVKQTVSGVVGQLAPILASQSSESKKVMDPKYVQETAAFITNRDNWNFLLQLGVHLDVVSPQLRGLVHNPLFTGKGAVASDALSFEKTLNRIGDEMLTFATMMIHLKTSGAWDAYRWDKENQQFHYDEAADRQSRGDKIVDSVRHRQVADGILEPGQAMRGAYDVLLLKSLESSVSDVKGGYSPTSASELAGTVMGNQLLGYRRWYVRRALNAMGEKRVSAARGYVGENGEWHGTVEEGQWQSFQQGLAQLRAAKFNPTEVGKVWQNLEPQEQENLKRVAANAAVTLGATLAIMAVAGLWDDDEDKRNKKRSRQMGVLDTILQEASLFENVSFSLDAAANPLIMAAYFKQVSQLPVKLFLGDWDGAARIANSKIGALKAARQVYDWFDDGQQE